MAPLSPTSSASPSPPPPPSTPPPPPPPGSATSPDMIERNRSLIQWDDDDKYTQSAEAWLMRKDASIAGTALYLSRDADDADDPFIEATPDVKSNRGSPFNNRLSPGSRLRERLQQRLMTYSSTSTSSSDCSNRPRASTDDVVTTSRSIEVSSSNPRDDTIQDSASSCSSDASSGVVIRAPFSSPRSPTPTPSPAIIADKKNTTTTTTRNSLLPTMFRLSQRLRSQSCVQDKKFNVVRLHIYDLMASETVMQLPWGCHFPIGKCLSAVNDGLHALGTGAYHCGVEVNGVEYAFGANEMEGLSGVFTCIPKHSPGYEYRTTLDFGRRETVKRSWIKVPKVELLEVPLDASTTTPTIKVDSSFVYREYETFLHGHAVMREMAKEYMGCDYDLLKRNCCTFAKDACLRLGVQQSEIPTWFLNLADAGAVTKDMAESSLKPLQNMLSFNEQQQPVSEQEPLAAVPATPIDRGFEVICHERPRNDTEDSMEMEIVKVVESSSNARHIHVRRTQSCTY